MGFIGFRASDEMRRALRDYCAGRGMSMTECLSQLVETLLSEEGATAAKPAGRADKLEALEERVDELSRHVDNLAQDVEALKPPKQYVILRPDAGKGFKWDWSRDRYIKITTDEAEVEEASRHKGWFIEEVGA